MRYLLTAMLTLLVTSTAMAEEFVCTDVLEGERFSCELTDAVGEPLGSGCFVFAASTQATGLLTADLSILSPDGMSVVESTWTCGCGIVEVEESAKCYGVGPAFFPFTAVANGKVTGDDLVLETLGITGLVGTRGIATCVRDPGCSTGS